MLSGEKAQVSCLCASPNKTHLAAGYSDGNVQIFDLRTAEVVSIFSGHKSEVTALVFDQYGHKLASGAKVVCKYKLLLTYKKFPIILGLRVVRKLNLKQFFRIQM